MKKTLKELRLSISRRTVSDGCEEKANGSNERWPGNLRGRQKLYIVFTTLFLPIYNTITLTIKNIFCWNSTNQLGPQKIQPSLQVALSILVPTLPSSRTEVTYRETRAGQSVSASARISLACALASQCAASGNIWDLTSKKRKSVKATKSWYWAQLSQRREWGLLCT